MAKYCKIISPSGHTDDDVRLSVKSLPNRMGKIEFSASSSRSRKNVKDTAEQGV